MTDPLTDKQRAMLGVIEAHWRAHGVSPSVSELATALDLQKSTVHEHLMALKRKGALVHVEGQGRSWRPASWPAAPEPRIPIVGHAAAGVPSLALEQIEGWLSVPPGRESQEHFALRVRGESMLGAGILDGDLVVVRRQSLATDGDIVVALVDDESATIKRWRPHGPTVTLQPENPAFSPLTLPLERVRVQGKVVGLRRDYA
jgi:repressor LexA